NGLSHTHIHPLSLHDALPILPCFRIGTKGTFSLLASIIPNKKPRLSTPATTSMCNPDRRSANSATMALHKAWFFKIGVMSLNTMPGCGKSGISRMADFICSSNILLVEFQVGFNFTQKLGVHSIHPSEVGQRPEVAMLFPITK